MNAFVSAKYLLPLIALFSLVGHPIFVNRFPGPIEISKFGAFAFPFGTFQILQCFSHRFRLTLPGDNYYSGHGFVDLELKIQKVQGIRNTIFLSMISISTSVENYFHRDSRSVLLPCRRVLDSTGIAVNGLIRRLRLQRAAQLLGQNWGPVSQVAYEVGFSNLSYFSKVFKEEFGVIPSEYAGN
jgi:hypothetical protein